MYTSQRYDREFVTIKQGGIGTDGPYLPTNDGMVRGKRGGWAGFLRGLESGFYWLRLLMEAMLDHTKVFVRALWAFITAFYTELNTNRYAGEPGAAGRTAGVWFIHSL